jgi:hypothetical protein
MMASAAEKELAAFMAKYDPKIAKLGKAAFAHMQTRLPGAVSLVYDNYNALAIGFGPEGKAPPLSIALYPRWINLFFLFGAGLPDPHGLLQGKGSRVRSIRIDSVDRLDDPQIDTLITAAVLHAGWKLEPGKKNKVVIQSVSPTQRPRRP